MSALAERMATAPARKGKEGKLTFTAWDAADIQTVLDLEKGSAWTANDRLFGIDPTGKNAPTTCGGRKGDGTYPAYASMFNLAQRAMAASNGYASITDWRNAGCRTDVMTFFTFKVKKTDNGVTCAIIAR